MRICIVGTGVIGTIYGSLFAEAGHDVAHYVRSVESPRVRDGIRIELCDGRTSPPLDRESTYHPRAFDELRPDHDFELILASVRHDQLDALLPVLAESRGTAELLLFGGRWDALEPIDTALGRGGYLWGYPIAGGGFQDGYLDAALLPEVHLGALAAIDGRLDPVAELFRSCGLTIDVPADMFAWLVVHFAIEAGIIGAAIAAGDPEVFLDDVERISEGILAVRETLAIVRARGIDVDTVGDAQVFHAPAEAVAEGIRQQYRVDLAARKIMTRHTGRV